MILLRLQQSLGRPEITVEINESKIGKRTIGVVSLWVSGFQECWVRNGLLFSVHNTGRQKLSSIWLRSGSYQEPWLFWIVVGKPFECGWFYSPESEPFASFLWSWEQSSYEYHWEPLSNTILSSFWKTLTACKLAMAETLC